MKPRQLLIKYPSCCLEWLPAALEAQKVIKRVEKIRGVKSRTVKRRLIVREGSSSDAKESSVCA